MIYGQYPRPSIFISAIWRFFERKILCIARTFDILARNFSWNSGIFWIKRKMLW